MKALESSLVQEINFIKSLIAKGGPEPADYLLLDSWFSRVHRHTSGDLLANEDLLALREAFGDAMSPATLQGFVCARPHGYAGDYEIIDHIYSEHVSPNPSLARWDAYFQSQAAPKAVRNRKSYFHDLLNHHIQGCCPLRVLELASGPGRGMFEWLSVNRDVQVTFHCIELDSAAIAYAQMLNQAFLERIRFKQQNVVFFRPDQDYDLILAAGLFDYFDDRVFKLVLRRLLPALAPKGEIVIGNFSTSNPSRAYMEFGGWHLHHRTPEALASLAAACDVPANRIRIGAEAEGVNLFLHVSA